MTRTTLPSAREVTNAAVAQPPSAAIRRINPICPRNCDKLLLTNGNSNSTDKPNAYTCTILPWMPTMPSDLSGHQNRPQNTDPISSAEMALCSGLRVSISGFISNCCQQIIVVVPLLKMIEFGSSHPRIDFPQISNRQLREW